MKGSHLDRCGFPLSGLPRERPGVCLPLHLHRRRPGQQSRVHSSSVVGIPCPPPPFLTGAVTRVVCPLGPPIYAGSCTATRAPSLATGQGSAQRALEPLLLLSLSAVGGWSSPRQHHLCLRQSWGVEHPCRVPRERAPVPQAVLELLAACQETGRGVPGRITPPCRGREHQATHYPPHPSCPPPPDITRLHL